MKYRAVVLATALFLAGTAPVPAQRFSDAEKRAFAADPSRHFTIIIDHPEVLRTEVKSTKFTPNVLGGPAEMRAWIEVDAFVRRPVEEAVVEEIALAVRQAAKKLDSVGVRMILPDSGLPRDREVGHPFYAWRLFKDDAVDVRNTMGVPPSTVAAQVADLHLVGERLLGVWVDHNFANGAVALIENPAKAETSLAYLIDPAARYVLARRPRNDGKLVVAERHEGPLGSYKADGEEADRLAVALREDGVLLVYAGSAYGLAKQPWLIAHPWQDR